MVAWPSGLRRWSKVPVSSGAWVRIPPLPVLFFFFSSRKQLFLFTLLNQWLAFYFSYQSFTMFAGWQEHAFRSILRNPESLWRVPMVLDLLVLVNFKSTLIRFAFYCPNLLALYILILVLLLLFIRFPLWRVLLPILARSSSHKVLSIDCFIWLNKGEII